VFAKQFNFGKCQRYIIVGHPNNQWVRIVHVSKHQHDTTQ